MVKITNKTTSVRQLPARGVPGAPEAQPFRVRFAPGESVDVPRWYFDELMQEPGFSRLAHKPNGFAIEGAGDAPAPSHPDAAVAAELDRLRKANAELEAVAARKGNKKVLDEAEARAAEAEKRAAELEKRLAELTKAGGGAPT